MGRVDSMKRLQGLDRRQRGALCGPCPLRRAAAPRDSLRTLDEISNAEIAAAFALYWRQEVQAYIHAYRAVTGVDLDATAGRCDRPVGAAAAASRNGPGVRTLTAGLAVLDFTSALYLGLRHGADESPPWTRLTTGVPAALEPRWRASALAERVASLVGVERRCSHPRRCTCSGMRSWRSDASGGRCTCDSGAYPIARWGAERAAAHGIRLRLFPHHDADALDGLLRRHARRS